MNLTFKASRKKDRVSERACVLLSELEGKKERGLRERVSVN